MLEADKPSALKIHTASITVTWTIVPVSIHPASVWVSAVSVIQVSLMMHKMQMMIFVLMLVEMSTNALNWAKMMLFNITVLSMPSVLTKHQLSMNLTISFRALAKLVGKQVPTMVLVVRMKMSVILKLTHVTLTMQHVKILLVVTNVLAMKAGKQLLEKLKAQNVKISMSAQLETIVVIPMPIVLTTMVVIPVNVKLVGTQPVLIS